MKSFSAIGKLHIVSTTVCQMVVQWTDQSNIDYDIAATYTNALLDAYTDYKAVWKALQISKCASAIDFAP